MSLDALLRLLRLAQQTCSRGLATQCEICGRPLATREGDTLSSLSPFLEDQMTPSRCPGCVSR
jgi:hypothetical protein